MDVNTSNQTHGSETFPVEQRRTIVCSEKTEIIKVVIVT